MSWAPTTLDIVTAAIRVRLRNANQIAESKAAGLPDELATMRERDLRRQVRELIEDAEKSGSLTSELMKEFGNDENGK